VESDSEKGSLPQKLSDSPDRTLHVQEAPISAHWSDWFWCVPDALRFLPDETGLEFATPKAVRAEAQRILPELARETLTDGNHRTFVVSVRGEAGLSTVRISLTLVVEKGVLDASADRSRAFIVPPRDGALPGRGIQFSSDHASGWMTQQPFARWP
jgi:hypothetical protein